MATRHAARTPRPSLRVVPGWRLLGPHWCLQTFLTGFACMCALEEPGQLWYDGRLVGRVGLHGRELDKRRVRTLGVRARLLIYLAFVAPRPIGPEQLCHRVGVTAVPPRPLRVLDWLREDIEGGIVQRVRHGPGGVVTYAWQRGHP